LFEKFESVSLEPDYLCAPTCLREVGLGRYLLQWLEDLGDGLRGEKGD
jgi:hypothetical protein